MSTVELTCLLEGHTQEYVYSVAFPLDLTIGDLLECAEVYHVWSECPCQTVPSDIAWVANMKTLPEHKLDFTLSARRSAKRCQRSDPVHSLSESIESSAALHLVIEHKPRPAMANFTEFFRSHQVGTAVAHKCGPFDRYRIQPRQETDFYKMRSTPGTLMVDKTSFAPPMKLHLSSRNVVIRRPSGFGKTTFLSMLATYVNLEEIGGEFFAAADPESIDIPKALRSVDGRHGLLVISLDLSKLSLSDEDSEEAILARCNTFMNDELCGHAARYHELLHPTYGPHFDEIDSTWSFIDRLRKLRVGVMVAVDNYTSPFDGLAGERRALIERVTYHSIIDPLMHLMECNLVRRSYFVGRDIPPNEPLPWFDQREFRNRTMDLTESNAAEAAFGLSASEIRALWQVAFPKLNDMPNPLGLVDPGAAENDGRQYSIRDVLDILDDLKSCSSDEERVNFQPKCRAAFITRQPKYMFQPSDTDNPALLARVDAEPTEWAREYVPPSHASEELSSEPLAQHNAMLAARDEAILRHMDDPTAEIPGIHRMECRCDHRLHGSREKLLSHEDFESDRASFIGSDLHEDSIASTAPTSLPSSVDSSPRSSKRSRSDEDEGQHTSDTTEDVSAYSSDSDRSSSGRSVRRRLQFDFRPGSP